MSRIMKEVQTVCKARAVSLSLSPFQHRVEPSPEFAYRRFLIKLNLPSLAMVYSQGSPPLQLSKPQVMPSGQSSSITSFI